MLKNMQSSKITKIHAKVIDESTLKYANIYHGYNNELLFYSFVNVCFKRWTFEDRSRTKFYIFYRIFHPKPYINLTCFQIKEKVVFGNKCNSKLWHSVICIPTNQLKQKNLHFIFHCMINVLFIWLTSTVW